jgi:16S rRNA (adenine1518-N6/adenine1519-N6)-dimethyltransferase
MNREELKNFLEENQFFPQKSLGQNFLIDDNILEKITRSANILEEDTIIEVGAGLGFLTKHLSKKANKIIAVEKDLQIIPLLQKLTTEKNIEVIREDILEFKLPKTPYKVVANVPYYITSPIIRKFLEAENQPSLMVLTVQKEVAQRITEKPPRMNLLAVSVQFFAKPKIISHIPPSAFFPSPKVTSSILQIIPYNKDNVYNKKFRKHFFQLARCGFSHPRKQLITNFKSLQIGNIKEKMIAVSINPQRRAETLSVEEWISLTKEFLKNGK